MILFVLAKRVVEELSLVKVFLELGSSDSSFNTFDLLCISLNDKGLMSSSQTKQIEISLGIASL